MDRNEAVLRELNLYPLWQRRGEPALVETAVEAVHSVSSDPSGQFPSQSISPAKAGSQVAGDSVMGEERAAVVPMGGADKSREQRIGELDWPQLKAMVRDCTACRLRAGCTQTVFGVGDEQAEWLFVGEGPGADEDAQGEPFVGQAGKLLDNMLLAIKLRRGKNVYIANIVKCRPPNNRTPEADEIATCLPYLQRQIELIKPKLIVALGKTAATALLGRDATLGSLRGKLHDFNGIPLLVTYHPAYLLRSPMEKAKAWQDLCLAVRARHGEAQPSGAGTPASHLLP
ncbi:MAG TPA: uracil-DNA glycosylase [Gallionella sp.]|nr:uracil-DNA glycosylase [Gallionella sp.]